jgi:hypothetical protein
MTEMSIIEDWEELLESDGQFIITELNKKQLEERKLVEESDNQLTRQLFQDEEEIVLEEPIKITKKIYKPKVNKSKISNQIVNEIKQKKISTNYKNLLLQKKKLAETFGEAENKDNEYEDLEDKFYT